MHDRLLHPSPLTLNLTLGTDQTSTTLSEKDFTLEVLMFCSLSAALYFPVHLSSAPLWWEPDKSILLRDFYQSTPPSAAPESARCRAYAVSTEISLLQQFCSNSDGEDVFAFQIF